VTEARSGGNLWKRDNWIGGEGGYLQNVSKQGRREQKVNIFSGGENVSEKYDYALTEMVNRFKRAMASSRLGILWFRCGKVHLNENVWFHSFFIPAPHVVTNFRFVYAIFCTELV
jgi:hypothetical protein